MGRIVDRLFVGFTLFLISFIAYSSQIFVVWPWYSRVLSVELIALLLPFNVLVGMLLWNYYLCLSTDPGRVPKAWEPDFQDTDGYEVKKLTRGPRYCRTCECYKPPRAHHCRQCRRCVLRMDHHCPWVNNCVGHYNYGHFLRFLFYVDLACSYHLAMVTRRVLAAMSVRVWDEPTGLELIFIVLNYTFCVPVLLSVGAFSIYHFRGLMRNTTTIEGWEKDKVATLVRRGRIQEIKFPYNLGVRRNVESILGSEPLYWCWPTVPPGTGLKYQLAEGREPKDAESWPPKDPNAYPDADPRHVFTLPSTPWTYENGTLNPNLRPSNGLHRRGSSSRSPVPHSDPGSSNSNSKSKSKAIAAVPPYHPDYRPPRSDGEDGEDDAHSDSPPSSVQSAASEDERVGRRHVRQGSEGYEVRPIDREHLLRRYIVGMTEEPGRYNRYVPEPPSESEEDLDEEVPLARRVESWRAGAVGNEL